MNQDAGMSTYQELKAQAEKLMQQAEEMRQQEVQKAVADIKEMMRTYGVTPRDLGFSTTSSSGARRSKKKSGSARSGPQYRGPEGQIWTAARGRKPRWLEEALKAGRSMDEFLVQDTGGSQQQSQ